MALRGSAYSCCSPAGLGTLDASSFSTWSFPASSQMAVRSCCAFLLRPARTSLWPQRQSFACKTGLPLHYFSGDVTPCAFRPKLGVTKPFLRSASGKFSTWQGLNYKRELRRRDDRWWRIDGEAGKAVAAMASNGSVSKTLPLPEELPKTFDFDQEETIYAWWESQGYFVPSEDGEGEPFVVPMPPPNVTGALHMGHAMFVTLEDIMTRHWRMRGRPTLWLPGTDHAGIATQLVVEKMLAAQGIKRTELGREEFLNRVWEWKEKYGGTIANQIRRLGASCDWSRERFTFDTQLSKAVMEAFSRLHEKGLIYRGSYMVNWSPHLQTAVSDLEVEYSEEPGRMYFLKYPVAGGSEEDYLPVATTRPETLLGDTAVAVHPEDDRYKHLVGKKAVVPMSNGREIPIIADEYVDREFGTGALKITPGHDPNDYAIGQRIGLPIINIMNKDGSLNENAGAYSERWRYWRRPVLTISAMFGTMEFAVKRVESQCSALGATSANGMDRFEAREQLWADLDAAGLAIKTEPHTLRVPRSQRGGEVVEPLVSKQWFVRMAPLAEPALEAVRDGSLRIIPERFEKIYNYWLENIRDWCISRQLWWGHRIPVWYVRRPGEAAPSEVDFVVARSEEEAYEKARAQYGADVALEQDPDVLDTWFSSGLWPFSTLGWPDTSSPDLARFYPTSVLETGHDILFFWVARMAMMGIEFTGKPPFHTVYLHGLVRDAQGRKMSKSLGNVIDPLDTIQEFGSDALRFTLATGTTPGQDVNLSMERLGANRAFTNKLWNAGKFILQNLPANSEAAQWEALAAAQFDTPESISSLPLAERWVLTRLHDLVDSTTKAYESLDFGEVGRDVYDFFWNDFADWYIEASKTRLYQTEDPETAVRAQRVLVYTFDAVLRLLHPFMPFVTERLWQALPHKGEALVVARWPARELPRDPEALRHFEELQQLVRSVRNARAEYSVEPAKRIEAIIVAGPASRPFMEEEKAAIAALARLDADRLQIAEAPPVDTEQAVHLVVAEGLEAYLPLAGMIDLGKEVERLRKQAAKLQTEADGFAKRLSSPAFVEKAPAAVVQGVRAQATEAEDKLAILRKRIQQLEGMASTVAQ